MLNHLKVHIPLLEMMMMMILCILHCHIVVLLGTFNLHKALQCHLQLDHLLHLRCLLLLPSNNLCRLYTRRNQGHLLHNCSNLCRNCTGRLHSLGDTEGLLHYLEELLDLLPELQLLVPVRLIGLRLQYMAQGR
jgi:hypothetical protein